MGDEAEIRVIVSNCSDLMPDSFSGEGFGYNCDDFFKRFRSWVNFQEARLPNDPSNMYCQTLQYYGGMQ